MNKKNLQTWRKNEKQKGTGNRKQKEPWITGYLKQQIRQKEGSFDMEDYLTVICYTLLSIPLFQNTKVDKNMIHNIDHVRTVSRHGEKKVGTTPL